jgi:hypothetical protein
VASVANATRAHWREYVILWVSLTMDNSLAGGALGMQVRWRNNGG